MKPHEHCCRCCWEVYTCHGCITPAAEYGVCPTCYQKATFAEATKNWRAIYAA